MVTNTDKNDGIILSIALFIGVARAFTFLQCHEKQTIADPQDDSPPVLPSLPREKQTIPDPQDDSSPVLPSLPRRLSFNSKRFNKRGSMGLGNGTNVHHHFPYHDPENVNHENGHSYIIEHTDPSMTESPRHYDFNVQDITHFSNPEAPLPTDTKMQNKKIRRTEGRYNSDCMLRKEEDVRSNKNTGIMPRTVTLIRHGQSEGNVDSGLFQTKPDNQMNLTEFGWTQARMAGEALRNQICQHGESLHFIVSPYVRTMETFHGIASAWCDPDKEFGHIKDRDLKLKAWYDSLAEKGLSWHEDPRIREQDFGNYQDADAIKKAKIERRKFGVFYYRFLNGESASDVFDRVSTFLDSLWRSFQHPHRAENYVLVTHGISIRVLLARYFRYSIDQFNMMKNPKNCEMIILRHDGEGRLQLDGQCNLESEERIDEAGVQRKLLRYRFCNTLRAVSREEINERVIRMSFNDK